MKYLTQDQVNHIQGRLKMRGHNTVSLAKLLDRPWSTVAGVINGNRRTQKVRELIADFLEQPVSELFPDNGHQGQS